MKNAFDVGFRLAVLIVLSSCSVFPIENERGFVAGKGKICTDVNIHRLSTSRWNAEKNELILPPGATEHQRVIDMKSAVGISSECQISFKHFHAYYGVEYPQPQGIGRSTWLIVSSLTLGVIPYTGTANLLIQIKSDSSDKIEFESKIPIREWSWIVGFPLMMARDDVKYPFRTMNEYLAYGEIARGLRSLL